jgi:hypothetical protein
MALNLFGKKDAASPTLGAAMLALVGATTVTPEMASAANEELTAMGISGAALITEAALDGLETAETAWNATQEALTAAGATDVAALASERDTLKTGMATVNAALTAAGAADVTALAADRDKHKADAEQFGSQPGAVGTSSTKNTPDASEEGGDEHANAIDALPHNQALKGHPLFG